MVLRMRVEVSDRVDSNCGSRKGRHPGESGVVGFEERGRDSGMAWYALGQDAGHRYIPLPKSCMERDAAWK